MRSAKKRTTIRKSRLRRSQGVVAALMEVIRLDSDKDALREMVKAFLSAFAFVIAVALLAALVCGLTGCAADGGELVVDENPPAPLQTRTYDAEIDGDLEALVKLLHKVRVSKVVHRVDARNTKPHARQLTAGRGGELRIGRA